MLSSTAVATGLAKNDVPEIFPLIIEAKFVVAAAKNMTRLFALLSKVTPLLRLEPAEVNIVLAPKDIDVPLTVPILHLNTLLTPYMCTDLLALASNPTLCPAVAVPDSASISTSEPQDIDVPLTVPTAAIG